MNTEDKYQYLNIDILFNILNKLIILNSINKKKFVEVIKKRIHPLPIRVQKFILKIQNSNEKIVNNNINDSVISKIRFLRLLIDCIDIISDKNDKIVAVKIYLDYLLITDREYTRFLLITSSAFCTVMIDKINEFINHVSNEQKKEFIVYRIMYKKIIDEILLF